VACGMQDCQTEATMEEQNDLNSRCICPRKRKEQEDVSEHDVKVSKSSPKTPRNPVFSFMQKWSEPITQEHLIKETLKEQKSSRAEQAENLPWVPRQCNESSKENQPECEEKPMEKSFSIESRFEESASYSLSEKHLESNYPQLSKTRASKSSRKRKEAEISKKLSLLQDMIETCELTFRMRTGYRPSYADKLKDEELNNLINQQTKLHQELKELKENGSAIRKKKEVKITIEQERDVILEKLRKTRLTSGRPTEIAEMTPDQLKEEKLDMESQLLEFEKVHGQLINKADKEVMSCLYERFRQVKRSCRRSSNELMPIPEGESVTMILASPTRRPSVDLDEQKLETLNEDEFLTVSKARTVLVETEETGQSNEENWHTMSFGELNSLLRKLKTSKRNLKQNIDDFEESFQRTTGRKVSKDDRLPIERMYLDYKVTKSKIKLIRALLDKSQ